MDWTKFIDDIAREWSVIKQAPRMFIAASVLLVVVIWGIVQWHFSETIEVKTATIEQKEATIEGLKSVNDDLRERLHLVPVKNRFVQMTNAELKKEALSLASEMLAIWNQRTEESSQAALAEMHANVRIKDREAKERMFEQSIQAEAKQWSAMNSEYEQKFRADAILLRDEMFDRLRDSQKINALHHDDSSYEAGGRIDIVAENLQKIAKQIPDRDSAKP